MGRPRAAIVAPVAIDWRIAQVATAVAVIAEIESVAVAMIHALVLHRGQDMNGSDADGPDVIVSRVRIKDVNDDVSSAAANDRL